MRFFEKVASKITMLEHLQVFVLALLFVAATATVKDTRCEPFSSEKIICYCIDWTGRQQCAPRVAVLNENECVAAGGQWGRTGLSSINLVLSPLTPLSCGGEWMRKSSRSEAEIVYDAVMEVRSSNTVPSSGSGVVHVSGGPIASLVSPLGINPFDVQLASQAGDVHSIVVSPSFGPTSGGVWVQIMGAGSYHTPNSLQCKLDLVEQFCYSNHYMYAWCYVTPKCPGVFPFRCHNGPLKFEGKYAVVAKIPWVTSVYPYSGDTLGGTAVTVRGWNFEPHCPSRLLCRFGSTIVPAKYYTSSSIICVAPCSLEPGFVSVESSNDGGEHWSMSGVQFGYVGDKLTAANVDKDECSRYIWKDSVRSSEVDGPNTK